jgi:hypothetical protein
MSGAHLHSRAYMLKHTQHTRGVHRHQHGVPRQRAQQLVWAVPQWLGSRRCWERSTTLHHRRAGGSSGGSGLQRAAPLCRERRRPRQRQRPSRREHRRDDGHPSAVCSMRRTATTTIRRTSLRVAAELLLLLLLLLEAARWRCLARIKPLVGSHTHARLRLLLAGMLRRRGVAPLRLAAEAAK